MRSSVVMLIVGVCAVALFGCAMQRPEKDDASAQTAGILTENEWGDLFAAMGEEYVAFGRRFQEEVPVKAYVCYQGEGGGDPIWFDESDQIVSMFNALAAANVSDDPGMVSTDDYTSFGFEFADGTSTHFMFESMVFDVVEGNSYKFYRVVTNPELDAYISMARRATLGT